MKKAAIIFLTVLLALLAWWLWSRWKTSSVVQSESPAAIGTGTLTQVANSAAGGTTGAKPDLKAQLSQIMEDANRPISFYGLVIDQDDRPIPGVKITLQIRHTKAVGPIGIEDTFDYPVLTTGDDGRFTLTNARGALLAIKALEKPGYEPSVKALRSSYWYWREPKDAFHPNAEQPEVFRMWKKAGAEPLIRNTLTGRVSYVGVPKEFDLLAGEVVSSHGDLRLVVNRNPQTIRWGQRNYEWTVELHATNGGLVLSVDEQMYLAPPEGYESMIRIHMAANDPTWSDHCEISFYCVLNDRKIHGRATLRVMLGSDKEAGTPYTLSYFINPSGSRNLEYDPLQNIPLSARVPATDHPQR